jgi:hypothetical protein
MGKVYDCDFNQMLGIQMQKDESFYPWDTPAEWALRAAGLLATLAVTVLLTRVAKKALSKRTIQ